jgi:AraC family transcriptional regulator
LPPEFEYERRVHRAMDYIQAHLGDDISLETLAREAAFSPYHFHRIFTALVGEPVAAFIRRVRLEAAAAELVTYPRRSITEIAFNNGFSSSAVFARAFQERFQVSASAWRKNRKTNHKPGQESAGAPRYALPCWVPREGPERKENEVEVRIEEMPAVRAAYVRRQGEYYISACQAWDKLCAWAGPRGLLDGRRMLFSISHDDPSVTEAAKLRYDACIEIGPTLAVDDAVGVVELPARRVAKARYEGPGRGIMGAYASFYGEWLPKSGFVPGEAPPIEVYYPEQGNAPERDHFVMDICMPVVPA